MYRPIQYIDPTKINDGIRYREYLPSPALSEYVSCFWSVDTFGSVNDAHHRILPDGCADIIFDFMSGDSFFTGVVNETAHLYLNGEIRMTGIRFLPKAIPFILKSDASEFLNNGFETKYAVAPLRQMAEKVASAPDINHAVGIICCELERYFTGYCVNQRFLEILDHSLDVKGAVTVQDLASYHQISTKQILRYFKEHIGLSAKEFLQIVRFQNLLGLMSTGQHGMLYNALESGYYDQSHAIKDLKKYL